MRRYALLLALFSVALTVKADGVRYNSNTILPDDTTTWTGRMQRQIDSLVNLPLFETTQLGLYVYDLTDGRDLVCVNHRQRMRPASCEKVVTSVSALHHLGPSYQFRTQMFVTGEVRDSVLWGDVCFVAGMDPLLAQGEVYQMARALREVGIDSLAGVITLDLSFKDQDDRGWGWCWDDDVAPLRPLLVDKHDRFTAELLADLRNLGIRGASLDRVMQGPCPPSARLFCEVTHTIDQVLDRMMKRSDNYYAESLFYQLAALSGRKRATRKEAVGYIDQLIRQVGLNPADYQIADGSGLSLYDYVSPELLVRLLQHAWQNEPIRAHLYPSLPIAGVDGTLEKRMRRTAAEGNVHAKTGTVDGIVSLSGYCTSPEGHVLVFSIINQGISRAAQGRNFQDRVCEALCGGELRMDN
ncbi:MAG: D-alanyl-D-alanine carboxypeptidase/D-alanyl-D-alanine-endopeptidase [Bacteroidaceae bacterium]|nr:D-alanyl-D-alanine carboxypeptidase/D-alanyl-D-alanine-endopeptidase [Bacteroidaceae bacterium]